MTKKLLTIIMTISLLFTLLPVGLSVSAADPEGTIIVKNDTTTYDDPCFIPYSDTYGGTTQTINANNTSNKYVESIHKGYDNHTAVQSLSTNQAAWYRFLADGVTDGTKAGVYDVYFWNICDASNTEKRAGADTHPDYHAQYDVLASGRKTTYYIDQQNVSGGVDGWVKLGTHYFDGMGSEYVSVIKNYHNNSSTYLSAVKFVPVDKPSSAKLIHMHMRSYDNSTNRYTHIEAEDTPVISNTIIKQLPNTYDDNGARAKKISLTFQAEDPQATVQIVPGDTAQGRATTEYYAKADEVFYRDVIVTSQDGKNVETYKVAVGVDGASVINYKAEDATIAKRGALYTGTNASNYDDVNNANTNTEASPEGFTKRLRLYGLGDTATWTVQNTEVTTPGYYSVYVWSTSTNAFQDEKTEIIVNHAGLRETRQVTVGNYHITNPKWAYAGSYYFDGSGTETVAAMKTSATLDSAALVLSGIKLVPCKPTEIAEDFDGITITAAGKTVSMTKRMIEDGKYVQPLQPDSYTTVEFKVIGSNSNYEYIKVNGAQVNVNTAMNLAVNNGAETNVNLEIKLAGEKAKTYKLALYKESTNVTVGTGGNVQNVEIPISTDFSSKVATVKSAAADAGFRLEKLSITEDAYYKILVWKPGFNYHVKSNNTKAATGTEPKAMSSSEQPITINTGAKIINKTIDWTGTESGWVDLGTYQMKPSGFTDTTSEFCVTFDYLDDAYTLINQAKYLKLSNGFLIDGEFYTDKSLNDSVIYTSADMVNITPIFDSVVTVNGETAPNNEALACDVEDGLNRIKVTVGDSEINFAVVRSGRLVAYNDSRVTGNSAGVATSNGYNGLGVMDIMAGTATINMPAGEGKLSVWFDALNDTLTGAGLSSSATVKAGGAAKEVTITESGWYEIGTYSFDEGDDVTITVSGDTNIALFSAVKLESASAEFDILEPVVEINNIEVTTSARGSANAWIYAYNGTETAKNVNVILAVYEKDENNVLKLTNCKINEAVAATGFNVISTESVEVASPDKTVIKAFLWNTADNSPITNETLVEAATSAE